MQALISSVAALVGACASLVAMAWLARTRVATAQRQAQQTLAQARDEAAAIAAEAQRHRQQQKLALQERAQRAREDELRELESDETEIQKHEALAEARCQELAPLESTVESQGAALDEKKKRLRELKEQAHEIRGHLQAALEERGGMSREEVLASIIADRVSKAEHDAHRARREAEEHAQEMAPAEAKRLLDVAIERYDGEGHLDRMQNTVPIPDKATLAALADPRSETHKAFIEAIGGELTTDEEAGTVSIRGDDPLGREVARRALRQIANRSLRAPDKIRALARQVREELQREVHNAGRKAFRALGLKKAHPDIIDLVGRLKFRLSYSQNQLKHSLEVAQTAGILAQELRLDVGAARRGGLLHDIGKAKTHDHEGSHAVLGADEARRCGEDAVISNAIGAHHGDEKPISDIAYVVAAADAISGARPGARREVVTLYLERMRDIQRIAGDRPGVCRVDLMKAGREVRVVVAGDERGDTETLERAGREIQRFSDADLQPLAAQIARDIDDNVTFPGQIKVTVIRESHAITIAR